jgi:hypothetical protein
MSSRTNYILIDYENVQPKNLEILLNHPFKVIAFVGANQTKIPFDLADAMQALGENATYIKISGNGQNALDFHIAFYIGEISAKHPEATFHIISRDTGFDPLIRHLKAKKIRVQRDTDLAEIPVLRMPNATSSDEKIEAVVRNLTGRGSSRPRKMKTLSNPINSLFAEKLADTELVELIEELQKRKFIAVNQGNISYKIPRLP